MDLMGIDIDKFSDIGFALLVGAICLRTLLFDRDANIKQRAIWKHELTELEKSLKQLIIESTEACEIFDTRLNQRQKNIETLLERVEVISSEVFAKITLTANSRNKIQKPAEKPVEKIAVEKLEWELEEDDELPDTLPSHLADSLDEIEDRSSIKSKTSQKIDKPALTKREIPKAEPAVSLSDEKIFSQTSIVDPIAFRIAKRLLLEGKELHIIARKLEIPVSEIRHLESLIRQTAQIENAELPETFLSKEIENVTKVIRDPAVRKSNEKSLSGKIETVRDNVRDEAPMLSFEQDEPSSVLFNR